MDGVKFKQVVFHGRDLLCAKKDRNIYVSLDNIFRGIGLDNSHSNFCYKKIMENEEYRKAVNFSLFGDDVKSESAFILIANIPLFLNKIPELIPVTNSMRNYINLFSNECGAHICDQFKEEDVSDFEMSKFEAASPANSSTPLSREEIAVFMMYETRHVDSLEKMMSEFMKNTTDLLQIFMKNSAEIIQTFSSSALSVIGNANSDMILGKPIESAQSFNTNEWIIKMTKIINDFCKENNCREQTLMNRMYKRLQAHNIDYNNCRHEYMEKHKVGQCSSMLALSETAELREIYESCLLDAIKEPLNFRSVNNRLTYTKSTPEIIKEKLNPLVFEGENSRSALYHVYREMEKYMKCPLKDLLAKYKEENNLKGCNMAFMIANTPELLELFDKAVKNLQ